MEMKFQSKALKLGKKDSLSLKVEPDLVVLRSYELYRDFLTDFLFGLSAYRAKQKEI